MRRGLFIWRYTLWANGHFAVNQPSNPTFPGLAPGSRGRGARSFLPPLGPGSSPRQGRSALLQPDAWPFAIFVDEDDAGCFQCRLNGDQVVRIGLSPAFLEI
mgnify:CR=1 FL=1